VGIPTTPRPGGAGDARRSRRDDRASAAAESCRRVRIASREGPSTRRGVPSWSHVAHALPDVRRPHDRDPSSRLSTLGRLSSAASRDDTLQRLAGRAHSTDGPLGRGDARRDPPTGRRRRVASPRRPPTELPRSGSGVVARSATIRHAWGYTRGGKRSTVVRAATRTPPRRVGVGRGRPASGRATPIRLEAGAATAPRPPPQRAGLPLSSCVGAVRVSWQGWGAFPTCDPTAHLTAGSTETTFRMAVLR
jgi:hypothetical protein